jgi:cytochrome c556
MRELDRLRSARLPQELDLERERRRQAEALARTARALAETSGEIGAAAPLGEFSPAERAEFDGLAAALRARAERLAADAPSLDPAALDARLAELDATCAACHHRFRRP